MNGELLNIWNHALPLIEEEVTPVGYQTWILSIEPLNIENGFLNVSVPTDVNKNMVDHRYKELIQNAVYEVTGTRCTLVVHIGVQEKIKKEEEKAARNLGMPLNPKYTFDSFVVGGSNRFAHAASLAVAETPARTYNPLFLYGGVGLGKTHLLHAIGNFIIQNNNDMKVMYISAETFTTELINSIKDSRNDEFREKYRSVDVLMVDDIQFIAGKKVTEEEFFHTFNTLYDANKQIIITSDRPPKEMRTLEDRLRSRFEWGIIGDLYAPDYETRVAILRKKAQLEQIEIKDEILELIAENITSNIRELEGVLNRVVAYRGLINSEITAEIALDAMKSYQAKGGPAVTPEEIVEKTAKFYHIKEEEIMGNKRTKNIARARQVAMYLMREILGYSHLKIAKYLDKHHTTVMYGIGEIETSISEDTTFRMEISTLKKDITE
ncbi:MAG: chromosomal replication initiator protein DnaA [Clostridia bacterium]|nr:chromosomal replication initiator protein DnaA [Oscillospiraceae bacterium]MBQ7033811.1 chromosomal replication initiator protein DnaA [Clostridia bacterium]